MLCTDKTLTCRNPLQQFGDMVGMYAYLVAVGGLQYWPALRRTGAIEEQTLPDKAEETEGSGDPLADTVPYEYDLGRVEAPAA